MFNHKTGILLRKTYTPSMHDMSKCTLQSGILKPLKCIYKIKLIILLVPRQEALKCHMCIFLIVFIDASLCLWPTSIGFLFLFYCVIIRRLCISGAFQWYQTSSSGLLSGAWPWFSRKVIPWEEKDNVPLALLTKSPMWNGCSSPTSCQHPAQLPEGPYMFLCALEGNLDHAAFPADRGKEGVAWVPLISICVPGASVIHETE